MRARDIREIVPALAAREGAGFLVHRAFPSPHLDMIDPFLLLDEMGPEDVAPGQAQGAPDHPHRGFETVTYLVSGAMRHADSHGNTGRLEPGDVQWMTAGAGVIHSEMPSREMLERGGRMHGFQLWVNLPARDKMMPPRYQEISGSGLPVARSEDGLISVRVIAGASLGARAVIDTRTPIGFLHFTMQPGARMDQPVPEGHHAFAYPFAGTGRFGGEQAEVGRGHAVVFGRGGDSARLACPAEATEPLEVLLVHGAPLHEPVARYGPFVMNTRDQLIQAMDDFRAGRFGDIPAAVERS